MQRRSRFVALLLALAVPLLAACGGATANTSAVTVAPTPPAAPAAVAPVQGATAGAGGDVTRIPVESGAVLRFVAAGNATEQQIYLDALARFKQLFPNITVNFEPINDAYETRMIAEFTAESAPDVLLVNGELMGLLGLNGVLLPLDNAMQQAGVKESDYVDAPLKLYKFEQQTYAIPKDFNPLVVFVNNDLAQKAGVDPAAIKTWDDLKAAAQKMTTGDGPSRTYGMCLNPDIQRIGAAMLQNGNAIIADGKAVFNQPQAVQAIDYWYSFKRDGVGQLYSELGRGWCGEAFAGRNTAMAVEGGWLVPFMTDPKNGAADMKYTAIPLPTPPDGKPATWLFTNGIGASATTRYPNAAAALTLFMTSAANEQPAIATGLAQPSLKSLANDPYYRQNPVAKVLVDQGQNGQLADSVLGGPVYKGDVINALNKEAIEPIFLGARPVQQALDRTAQLVNDILAQQ